MLIKIVMFFNLAEMPTECIGRLQKIAKELLKKTLTTCTVQLFVDLDYSGMRNWPES